VTIAFVDVPGHERFVKTMLAGAGGIDCVMLIVAADESVMPQTREHFDICRLLRVEHGIVVITKADVADQDTRELVRLEVRELVEGSFLEQAPVVEVSARTGQGLDDLRRVLTNVAGQVKHRRPDGPARLPIDRAFTMQGFGTVVTGTLVSGRVRVDDELGIVPGDSRVRVRGVQVHGRRREEAVSGQRTAINLGGIEVGDIARGQSLATPGTLTMARRVDAILDLLPGARDLKHGARVRFHQGTTELLARVSIAGDAGSVSAGTRAHVRIRLESPAAVTRGDRFILRAYSPTVTIGGGLILDPDPPRGAIRSGGALERWSALAADQETAILQMISDAAGHGFPLAAMVSRAGRTAADAETIARRLTADARAQLAGDRLVASDVMRGLASELLRVVGDFHKGHPLESGISREEARARVFARAHAAVFERVVQDLVNAKALIATDRLALPQHRLDLAPEEAQAHELIEQAYKRGGLKPPDAPALVAETRVAAPLAEKMTTLLVRQKRLQRVDTLLFHVDALQTLKSDIQGLKSAAPEGRATVDVATFKDRFGVSRKFAIPLLEWLDRERVTRRVGQTRVVL
jgi:selenocysteine-specific elongation factor